MWHSTIGRLVTTGRGGQNINFLDVIYEWPQSSFRNLKCFVKKYSCSDNNSRAHAFTTHILVPNMLTTEVNNDIIENTLLTILNSTETRITHSIEVNMHDKYKAPHYSFHISFLFFHKSSTKNSLTFNS